MSFTLVLPRRVPTEYRLFDQADDILQQLNADRRNGDESCDIRLKCGETIFHAHKNILSKGSEYFRKLFYTEMMEKQQTTIEVNLIDAKILALILDSIYLSKITITNDNIYGIIKAANYLLIKPIQDSCCDFILQAHNESTAVVLWLQVQTMGVQSLIRASAKFIRSHFSELSDSTTICSMDISAFKRFLAIKPKDAKGEETAFQFTVAWVKHGFEERRHLFPQLFELINLHLMSLEFFSYEVASEELVLSFETCLQRYVKHVKYFHGPRPLKSILSMNKTSTLLVMLDINAGVEKEISKPCTKRLDASFVVYNSYLYMVGGSVNGSTTNSVVRLDLNSTNRYADKETLMTVPRRNAAVAVEGYRLYVFGGYIGEDNDKCAMNPEEYYLIHKKAKWTSMNDCQNPVHQLVVFKGYFYTFSFGNLLICERYGHGYQTSQVKQKLPQACVKVVAVKDQMYALCIAANSSDGTTLTLRSYDPESDKSTIVSEIDDVGEFRDACAAHGRIVISYESKDSCSVHISTYHLEDNTWKLILESEDLSSYWKLIPYHSNPFQ